MRFASTTSEMAHVLVRITGSGYSLVQWFQRKKGAFNSSKVASSKLNGWVHRTISKELCWFSYSPSTRSSPVRHGDRRPGSPVRRHSLLHHLQGIHSQYGGTYLAFISRSRRQRIPSRRSPLTTTTTSTPPYSFPSLFTLTPDQFSI